MYPLYNTTLYLLRTIPSSSIKTWHRLTFQFSPKHADYRVSMSAYHIKSYSELMPNNHLEIDLFQHCRPNMNANYYYILSLEINLR